MADQSKAEGRLMPDARQIAEQIHPLLRVIDAYVSAVVTHGSGATLDERSDVVNALKLSLSQATATAEAEWRTKQQGYESEADRLTGEIVALTAQLIEARRQVFVDGFIAGVNAVDRFGFESESSDEAYANWLRAQTEETR